MLESIRTALLRRKATKLNRNRITVETFMRSLGATEAELKQWSSAFGTKLRKAHEARYGQKPDMDGATVVLMKGKHQLVSSYAYSWDQLSMVIEVAMGYDPIEKLIGR